MKFILLLSLCCVCAHQVISADEPKEESKIWATLKDGVVQIFALTPKLTRIQYIELNRQVYDYCTNVQKFSQNSILNRNTGKSGGAELIGEELYQSLRNFLENYLDDIYNVGITLKDEELLTYYTTKWDEYRLSSRVLNGVFDYINRHWVRRQREEGQKDVHQVYHLALLTWREKLFKHISKQLTSSILNLIERERNGEIINSNIISKAISTYVELGIDRDAPNARGTNLFVYKESFENELIEDTERYYIAESEEFLRQNSFTEYMKRVEQRINEETNRVESYLHKNTLATLMKVCDRVMIESCLDTFHTEFQNLLDSDRFEDLARLYALTARIPDGLTKLNGVFEEYVYRQGQDAITQVSETAKTDPKLYVQTILKVYEKYNDIVKKRLKDDRGFMAAMDKAFGRFVNDNAVTQTFKTTNKSPELLAGYCDLLLRKSSKTENLQDAALEAALNDAMTVFKFIQDRDVFQEFYTKKLASRLVNRMSVSDDAESLMIGKLKESCGFEYTNKLQKMYMDIVRSTELSEKFREKVQSSDSSSNIDLNAQVLSNGAWPFRPIQFQFQLPKDLVESSMAFDKFFTSEHSGRKLLWLYQMCKGEISTNFLQRKYIFQVSLFQMAVLLQFNDADSLTVDDLIQATGINEDVLIQVLQTLLKGDLLESKNEDELSKESVIELNTAYKNKKVRINLNVPLKKEAKKEQDHTEHQIQEGRKQLIQAAIVRVMKARQKINHQNLVIEVIKDLVKHFNPDGAMIKKMIEILIEKEYMERVEGERDTYVYMA